MSKGRAALDRGPAASDAIAPGQRLVCLLNESASGRDSELSDVSAIHRTIRRLQNGAVSIVEFMTEVSLDRHVPNAWNAAHIAGPSGGELARRVSTEPEVIGLGEDRNGQLLVAASMSGLVGFYAPSVAPTAERITFLGHDINCIRRAWIRSLEESDANKKHTDFDEGLAPQPDISKLISHVYLAKGRFWDTVHFDVRTNIALAMRKVEKAGIKIIPVECVITEDCRKAARLVPNCPKDVEAQQQFQALRAQYRLPEHDAIIILPTTALPAPRIEEWVIPVGRYDPDPYETVMPAVLGGSQALTIPNGYSAEGLPVGLMMLAPAQLTTHLFAFGNWFRDAEPWPSIARI